MTTTTKQAVSPLSQWIASTVRHYSGDYGLGTDRSGSFLVLLQYSMGFSVRYRMASSESSLSHKLGSHNDEDDDDKVYRRAGMKTPSEEAYCDYHGQLWLKYLWNEYNQQSNVAGIIVLETTGMMQDLYQQDEQQSSHHKPTRVVSVVTGWDDDNDDNDNDDENDDANQHEPHRVRVPLDDLDGLSKALEQQRMDLLSLLQGTTLRTTTTIEGTGAGNGGGVVVVVVESLTPLVVRHGFDRIQQWLGGCLGGSSGSSSSSSSSTGSGGMVVVVVVPVMVDTLTPRQHRALEDTVQAILVAQSGELTFLRRGVRERGNLLRDSLPFTIRPDPSQQQLPQLHLPLQPKDDDKNNLNDNDVTKGNKDESRSTSRTTDHRNRQPHTPLPTSSSTTSTGRRRQPIQLQLENDDPPRQRQPKTAATVATTTHRPRIYMEDDDPEFDDMDEEDPDDDLDI